MSKNLLGSGYQPKTVRYFMLRNMLLIRGDKPSIGKGCVQVDLRILSEVGKVGNECSVLHGVNFAMFVWWLSQPEVTGHSTAGKGQGNKNKIQCSGK